LRASHWVEKENRGYLQPHTKRLNSTFFFSFQTRFASLFLGNISECGECLMAGTTSFDAA
jgi:hypothetical protein